MRVVAARELKSDARNLVRKMDVIQFARVKGENGALSGEVHILINGRDLVQLIGEHERPFAVAEGSPSLAGAYVGLSAVHTAPPSGHFLGAPSWDIYRYGDKIQVLGCDCGEPGCWPLVCRIEVTAESVTWWDFEQPHRSGSKGDRRWRYDGLSPFVFDRKAYEAALNCIA